MAELRALLDPSSSLYARYKAMFALRNQASAPTEAPRRALASSASGVRNSADCVACRGARGQGTEEAVLALADGLSEDTRFV